MLERIQKRRENTQTIIDRILPHTENTAIKGQIALRRILNGLSEENQIISKNYEHDHQLIDAIIYTLESGKHPRKDRILRALNQASINSEIKHLEAQQNNKTQEQ